ncbi:hypothetical protein Taro_005380, partial [Colocasia esculenta]|nr:hypothetical protein [Colocasia esculenta]
AEEALSRQREGCCGASVEFSSDSASQWLVQHGVHVRMASGAWTCRRRGVSGVLWASSAELRPESLKVSSKDLQLCGLQVWCWSVSTVPWLVAVEWQFDLSSVTARLRVVVVVPRWYLVVVGVDVDSCFVEVRFSSITCFCWICSFEKYFNFFFRAFLHSLVLSKGENGSPLQQHEQKREIPLFAAKSFLWNILEISSTLGANKWGQNDLLEAGSSVDTTTECVDTLSQSADTGGDAEEELGIVPCLWKLATSISHGANKPVESMGYMFCYLFLSNELTINCTFQPLNAKLKSVD